MIPAMPWQARAACRGCDTRLWFPTDAEEGRGAGTWATVQSAIAVCETCPVVDACLDYAITNRETFGVWGAKSPRDRRRIARARRMPYPRDRSRGHLEVAS